MRCYALATRYGEREITWAAPDIGFAAGLFVKLNSARLKQELLKFSEQMDVGVCEHLEKDGYHFYTHKIDTGFYAIAVDGELTQRQLIYLYRYLLVDNTDLNLVANDLQKYTQDYRITEVNATLAETKAVMIDNIDKVLQRGEKIENLVDQTHELEKTTISFRKNTEDLNSCWPFNYCTIS